MGKNKQYTYTLTEGKTVSSVANYVSEYLSTMENMEVQTLDDDTTGIIILQARDKHGAYKQFIGMDRALTIHFKGDSDKVIVEFGEAKWVDKVTTLGVSMFVLWPLMLTSGYGMYKQKKLPEKIRKAIDEYIAL